MFSCLGGVSQFLHDDCAPAIVSSHKISHGVNKTKKGKKIDDGLESLLRIKVTIILYADAEPMESQRDSFKGLTHYYAEYRNTLSSVSGKCAVT